MLLSVCFSCSFLFNVVMIRHFIMVNTLDIVESGCSWTWRISIIFQIRWRGSSCKLNIKFWRCYITHQLVSDTRFLYQLAQACPHNVLHFLVFRDTAAIHARSAAIIIIHRSLIIFCPDNVLHLVSCCFGLKHCYIVVHLVPCHYSLNCHCTVLHLVSCCYVYLEHRVKSVCCQGMKLNLMQLCPLLSNNLLKTRMERVAALLLKKKTGDKFDIGSCRE